MVAILGFEIYDITSDGVMTIIKANKIVKQRTHTKTGYKQIDLRKNNGTKSTLSVHRLVCIAFHINPDNKPLVGHIDNSKLNSDSTNLRWCTYTEHCQNSTIYVNNKSGAKGITFSATGNKYILGNSHGRFCRLGVPCNKAAYFLAVHNSVEGFQGVTMRHFEMADEIWGVRTGTLGGKSTEPPNIKARIEPVFAYKKPVIDIYIDIFFVNREPYLITVAKPIGLIIAAHLPNRTANSIAIGRYIN
jgi:hypothetical protein